GRRPTRSLASGAVSRRTAGIRLRHGKLCPSRDGGACRCKPTYQADVWSSREGKRIFKTFATLAEAKAWRADAQVALRRGTMRVGSAATLREAAEAVARRRSQRRDPEPQRPHVQALRDPRLRDRFGDAGPPRARPRPP